jgi:hypothetical protein
LGKRKVLSRKSGIGNRKTVVKAIRIDADLNEALERLARGKGLTFNSLVSSSLSRYKEWDNQTDAFGFAELPQEMLRELLYSDTTRQFEDIGRTLGPRLLKELLEFWYKKATLDTFLKYAELISKYSGIAKISIDLEDGEYCLTYRHLYGERWSRFIAAYYGGALKELFDVSCKLDLSPNQVILKWVRAEKDNGIMAAEPKVRA